MLTGDAPVKTLVVTTLITGLTAAALLTSVGLPASAAGQRHTLRSLSNPTGAATVTLSSTTFSTIRTEFLIENLSTNASTRYVWGLGEFPTYFCRIPANTLTLVCQFQGEGTPQGIAEADLTGKTDVRVRWQRDVATLTYRMETWNGDCTGYASVTRPITGALSPLSYRGTAKIGERMQLAFLRMSSALDNSGECPVDAPPADRSGTILDFPFETDAGVGTRSDVGPRAYTLNASGASFVVSASYPPQAVIGGLSPTLKPVFRAGHPFTLDGSKSVGSPATYQWAQIAGPAVSVFSTPAAPATTITPPVAGQYTYRLTVIDAGGRTATKDLVVGIVTTDDNYVAAQRDPDFGWVLGKVVLHGRSSWPWYEVTEAADVDLLSPVMTTPPAETPGPGTLKATSPPNKVDLQGWLTSEGTGRPGIVWTGVGTSFTTADVGKRISIHWDADNDNTNKGRRVVYIAAVNSPTEIVASDYYMTEPPAKFSGGLSWGRLGESYYPYNSSDQNSQVAMFYEAGLAVGRLYAKTGLTTYRTQFHTFCDNWWRYGLGSGWAYPIPRNAGLHTMLACATDPAYSEPPGLWDGLARIARLMAGRVTTIVGPQVGYNPTSRVVRGTPDVREMSYVLRSTALLARTYGKSGGNTAIWCGYLANQVRHLWLETAAVPVGAPRRNYAFWEENLFLANTTYVAASHPAGDPNGRFGTSPWRAAGLPALALIYAYEALSDPRTCNNPILAAQLFNPDDGGGVIASAAHFIWDYGRSSDGGVFYNVGYESDSSRGTTVTNSNPAITLSVTNGSAEVEGTGTSFTTFFAPCDGTTYIGIVGLANPTVDRRVYQVTGCADNTHLTLNRPYAGPTERGLRVFARALRAEVACRPSLAAYCEPDLYSGRNLASDIGASAAWLYAKTGDATWNRRAHYYANKTFGGPSGGAGSLGPPTGSCVGDVASDCADGGHGNLGEILPPCGRNPTPCGDGALVPKYGKPLGMASGAGDTPVMLANLLARRQ